jgi:GNAT superfamily N-acetyltransferase
MSVKVRRMQGEDLGFANAVREQAGWNQTPQDWQALLDFSEAQCFVAEEDARAVGTVSVIKYGDCLAWIGMLLVLEECRGRGVGGALLQKALTASSGAASIGLDATPAGRPLYEKNGFSVVAELSRWEGQPQASVRGEPGILTHEHLSMDREAFGCDREAWLKRLGQRSDVVAIEGGFGMIRPGARAWYLGPLVASHPEAAVSIVDRLLSFARGEKVFWDAPDLAPISPADWGFVRQRPLYRMIQGKTPTQDVSELIAIADPATG